jgi:catechol 2,3-dioxygenase-like lactoylglutathione lyase family enzyme
MMRDRLKTDQVYFFRDLHDGPYGLTIYVADPDGLKVELYQTGLTAERAG